jgi:hypothetical protein
MSDEEKMRPPPSHEDPGAKPADAGREEMGFAARKVRELLAHARRLNRIEFDGVARLQGDAG